MLRIRIPPPTPPKTLLEIGCGGGHLLKVAQQNGIEPFGVELNPSQASYVKGTLGIQCETLSFTTKTFGDRKFDVIFHCNVTSHFYDPIAEFSAMRDKLTNGGCLVFETGNGADMDQKYYRYIPAWQYPDHLFFFGESSIRELLKRAGFSIVHVTSWSILPELAALKLLRHQRDGSNAGSTPNPVSSSPVQRAKLKQRIVRLSLAYSQLFLRFGLGAVLSNPRHPRTMLVWAR
jgi:SAM-dependent methyltransferase